VELQDCIWVSDLLRRLRKHTDADNVEREQVKGVGMLVDRLQRTGSVISAPRAKGHALRHRNSAINFMKPTEEGRHMAELLEMAGANDISPVVQLQVRPRRFTVLCTRRREAPEAMRLI
jgi:hypothetical protein